MNELSDFNLPEEIEGAVKAIFSHPKPDQAFVDRLGHQLSDQVEHLTTHQRKIQIPVSSLAWGVIGVIFILLLVWGINSLLPKVEPSRSTRPSPSPVVSPSPTIKPNQAGGVVSPSHIMEPAQAEGVINLPTLSGTPVPWPEVVITSINASQITQLSQWWRQPVRAIAWAPNGKSFAIASNTAIYILDSTTFEVINTINNGSCCIAYSPDGTKLASIFNETSIRILDVVNGSVLQTIQGHLSIFSELVFSIDGTILASAAYDEPVKLWNANTGQELHTLGELAANLIAFSPDGAILATVIKEKTIKLWDTASGEELRTIAAHNNTIAGTTFSPDGTRLISWANDMTIKFWDAATGTLQRTLYMQGDSIGRISILPDGEKILYCKTKYNTLEGEPIMVLDIASGKVLRTIGEDTHGCNMILSPDGKKVLCNSGWFDDVIKLFDISSGEELRSMDWPSYSVSSLAISPDGRIVAAGLETGQIKILYASNGQELLTLAGHTQVVNHTNFSLDFSPDGALLASGAMDGTARVWDVASGQELYIMDAVNELGWHVGMPSVDFSPDGKLLAFAGPSGQVKMWDAINHVELYTLGGQVSDKYVASIAFSPDGRILASGYSNRSITLWDVSSGKELRTLPHAEWVVTVSSLEFSPDGKKLAAGYWGPEIILWDWANGSELYTVSFSWSNEINGLVFSPGGDVLVVGGENGSIVLLDATSGRQLVTLDSATNGLAFSPDGKILISSSRFGSVGLWGIAPANAITSEVISAPEEAVNISITTPTPQETP